MFNKCFRSLRDYSEGKHIAPYITVLLTFPYDAVYTVQHLLNGYDTTSILLTSSLADYFQEKGKNFPLACL